MNILDIPAHFFVVGLVLWLALSVFFVLRGELIGAAVMALFFFGQVILDLVLKGKAIPNGQLVVIAFGPLLLFSVAFRQKAPVNFSNLAPFVLMAVVIIFSMIWNRLPFWEYKSALLPVLFAIIIYLAVPGIREMKMLIAVFMLFMVINTLVAGLQYAGFEDFYLTDREVKLKDASGFKRGFGLLGHFWVTGLISAASVPLATLRIADERRMLRKAVWAAVLVAALAGLMFSTLRAGFGGAVVGTLVALLWWNWRKALPYMVIGLVFISVLVLSVPIFKTSFSALWEHSTTLDNSAKMRPILAAQGMKLWKESPVFGVGPKGVSRHYGGGKGGNAHNSYIGQLSDYGLVGLVVFLTILILPLLRLKKAIRKYPEHRALFFGLIGTLICIYIVAIVHSMEDVTQFWMFPALALAVDRFSKKKEMQPQRRFHRKALLSPVARS